MSTIRTIIAGVALGLAGCTQTLYFADVTRTHDLSNAPPAGSVFIEAANGSNQADQNFPTYAADAAGWLGRWGYVMAPSAEGADYIVRISYTATAHDEVVSEPIREVVTECAPYQNKDGTMGCTWTSSTQITGYQDVEERFWQPHLQIDMTRGHTGDQQNLVQLHIDGEDKQSYDFKKDIPQMLEIGFDSFPGISGKTERIYLVMKDGQVCTGPRPNLFTKTVLRQCRGATDPAGTLLTGKTA